MPLHVLHLLARFESGGVSRYVLELSQALCDAGHRVTVAGGRGDWSDRFEAGPWRTLSLGLDGGPARMWRSGRRIERAVAGARVDLIHAHHRRASLIGRRLARRLGGDRRVPLLFSLHLPNIPMRPPWRWLSDFGDHALVPGPETRDWLIQTAGLDEKHVSVIPHGVRPERFPEADDGCRLEARRKLTLPERAPVAAFVGRLAPQKQPEWLLDVASAAPDAHVLIVGDGPDETTLRRRIERQGLGERVRLLGAGDPRSAYEACDLLLLPSRLESFALVCAEAMSVGRAVLRTRTGGWQAQILENHTGRSVEVDRDAFVAAAVEMLADRARLHEMGQSAAQHARDHLRFDHQFDATLALYRELIG